MNRLTAFASFLLLAACDCGGGGLPSRPCTTRADCPAGQLCLDGRCTPQDDPDVDAGPDDDCIDMDGDGFGVDCRRGPDCDDSDPTQGGDEICDGMDNDCDGEVDEGVVSSCGDCDPSCIGEGIGGEDAPFDPEMEDAEGVGLDDDGALILDSRRINTNFIWIANTGQGTVSRFDTETYAEVGRYYTGPAAAGNDPSRTSVNTLGDVYVGNRAGNTVSRISVLGADCPDTNGDGVVTTSSSGAFLPWGEDDCVLWHTNLEAAMPGERHVRAVAAQDVEGLDGTLQEFVWIGGYDTQMIAKLDGATGEVLFVTPAPARPYGFALDGLGNLWVSTRDADRIGRVDTTRCIDAASCGAPVCDGEGAGDACIKQTIAAPHLPYGITVDFNQRVWIGGSNRGSPRVPYFGRYDPTAPAGSRWVSVAVPRGTHVVNGIAADADGWVWGAVHTDGGVIRIEADNPTNWIQVPGTTGHSCKGMAVDAEGKAWAITQSDRAIVITPGPGIMDNAVNTDVARSIVVPYTYSDMTGLQLRLATNPRGYYRHVFEGCDMETSTGTDWGDLRFSAETPAGTDVTFRVRTADTRAALEDATWVLVATVPPDASPVSIRDALLAAGITPAHFLMVEIGLRAERSSSREVITPRVLGVDVTHTCPPRLD